MSNIDLTQIIGYIMTPVAGAVGWVFARRKRRNDAIKYMQDTIDLLAAKNAELHSLVERMREDHERELGQLSDQLRKVSDENRELKEGQERMIEKINQLKQELEDERKKTSPAQTKKPKTK